MWKEFLSVAKHLFDIFLHSFDIESFDIHLFDIDLLNINFESYSSKMKVVTMRIQYFYFRLHFYCTLYIILITFGILDFYQKCWIEKPVQSF